jgi:hypothetical protein
MINNELTSHELEYSQKAIMTLARHLLDPAAIAKLMLEQSKDNERAFSLLLDAAYTQERRTFVDPSATNNDARIAFRVLVKRFGAECVCELAKKYEEADSAA